MKYVPEERVREIVTEFAERYPIFAKRLTDLLSTAVECPECKESVIKQLQEENKIHRITYQNTLNVVMTYLEAEGLNPANYPGLWDKVHWLGQKMEKAQAECARLRAALKEAVNTICTLCVRLNPQHKRGFEEGWCTCSDITTPPRYPEKPKEEGK